MSAETGGEETATFFCATLGKKRSLADEIGQPDGKSALAERGVWGSDLASMARIENNQMARKASDHVGDGFDYRAARSTMLIK